MITQVESQELKGRVSEVAERLMSFRNSDGGKVMIDVPVTYPSGASVVVEVEQNADQVWVSDMGMGLVEAEMMAAHDSYQRLARARADEFGVKYDNSAMFVIWVPSGRLEAAVVCVANASAQASADAVRHAAEAQSRRQSDVVYERIRSVFGEQAVSRSVEIHGKRSAWEAHNVVHFPNSGRAVFEPMTMNPNSISSKFLMFSDLREASAEHYSLNAVIQDEKHLDEKAKMVGDVANIIRLSAHDRVFRQYGTAA